MITLFSYSPCWRSRFYEEVSYNRYDCNTFLIHKGHIAGPKFCLPESCLRRGMIIELDGPALGEKDKCLSLEDCKLACQQESQKCAFYDWRPAQEKCYFQEEDTGITTGDGIVGTVNCS